MSRRIRENNAWISQASCVGTDPDLWFTDNPPEVMRMLKTICNDCPVITQCRDHAIENYFHGFWGGLTMGERTRIKRTQKQAGEQS